MSPVFFTDRDLGRGFPDVLAAAGLEVVRHSERFRHDSPDEEWLEHVGKSGLVAITHDKRIRYKPNELAAVERHRVPLLVVSGKAPIPELAKGFVAAVPTILDFLARHDPPFIAKVYGARGSELASSLDVPASVKLWYPRR